MKHKTKVFDELHNQLLLLTVDTLTVARIVPSHAPSREKGGGGVKVTSRFRNLADVRKVDLRVSRD